MRCATCGNEEAVVVVTLTKNPLEGGNVHEGLGPTCAARWRAAPERNLFVQLMERQGGVNALQQYRDFQARVTREKAAAA